MSITVNIAKDKLSATVILTDAEGVTALAIRQALQSRGVTYGYAEDAIEQMAANPSPGEFEAAVGDAPVQGSDASIEYFFRTGKPNLTPQILEDGRTDYFNLGVVQNVEPGDVLARKTPAVPGIPGKTVTGDDLPPRVVKEINFRIGRGVELSPDALEVRATETGQPLLTRGILSVSSTFVVSGDVDFSVGNILFEGNVEVQGTVRTHFNVRAKGNITVHGAVEGGILEATGFIMVVGGVRQRAALRAEGDIQVRFMENSIARTPGNLFVKDDLLFSEVDVGGKVEVTGSLVGGTCKADVEVKADSIGSKMGTPTRVELTPLEKWLDVLRGFEARQAEVKGNVTRLEEGLSTLGTARERFHGLHPDKEALYERLNQALQGLQQESIELAAKVMQAKAKVESLPEPKILVRDRIHPGVQIRLNEARLNNEGELVARQLSEAAGKIKLQ